MTEVSIIIVSYNTRELMRACVRSVYEYSGGEDFEVIIVDNASSDDSIRAIEEEAPGAHVISLNRNVGFGAANNIGSKVAHGEFLLLLNPDTLLFRHTVGNMLEFAREHPQAGIYGGRTVFGDGRLNKTSCWGSPTVWSMFCRGIGLAALFKESRLFEPEQMGWWDRDSVRQVDIVSGCFMLIHRKVWEKLGGFDPGFFMYAEEFDFCLRARKMGYRPLFTPNAQIVHYGGRSDRVLEDQTVRHYCARAILFRKHWSRLAAWFGVRMLDLWAWNKMCRALLLRHRDEESRELADAWRCIWSRRYEWRKARPGIATQSSIANGASLIHE